MVSRNIPFHIFVPCACALWLVACGSGDTSGTGATGGGGAQSSGGSTGTGGDAGGGAGGSSTGGGGGAPAVAICKRDCQTPADCTTAAGAFDADNYTCNGGACDYKGCNSDAECATSFGDPVYICGHDPSYPYPSCLKGCKAAADCKVDGGAYDSDNYTCAAGECHYSGCKTNGECDLTYGAGKYVCGTIAGYPVQYCVKGCQSGNDCTLDSGAFSGDNYTCIEGLCSYTGCKDDGECLTTFGSPLYTCH